MIVYGGKSAVFTSEKQICRCATFL